MSHKIIIIIMLCYGSIQKWDLIHLYYLYVQFTYFSTHAYNNIHVYKYGQAPTDNFGPLYKTSNNKTAQPIISDTRVPYTIISR